MDQDGQQTFSSREHSGASRVNTGMVSSGKTTRGGSAKCIAELKLKYKLTEINTRVRINVYVWVKYSFVRFLYETLKVLSV